MNVDNLLTGEGGVSDEKSNQLCVEAMQERFDFLITWLMLSSFGLQIFHTKKKKKNTQTQKPPILQCFLLYEKSFTSEKVTT